MSDSYGHIDGVGDQEQLGEPAALPPRPQVARRRSLLTKRLTWRGILVVVGAIVLVRLFLIESVIVDGRSMANTLLPDEWVLVLKPMHPHRYSVVIFNDPEEKITVIKRVIGLPGDTIAIEPKEREGFTASGAQVWINNTAIDEPYARALAADSYGPEQVPADDYFVLGDNRDDSEDSRDYGPVKRSSVHGIALAVIYPFSRMRIIPHTAEAASYRGQSAGANAAGQ